MHGGFAALVIGVSLAIGTAGYHWLAEFPWLDAFLNASMLLGGMGPVGELATTSGKLFAALFAIYCGVVFLALAAILVTPVFHRVLHRFHWEQEEKSSRK